MPIHSRIHTDDLDAKGGATELEIAGDEPWLARVYADFAAALAAGGVPPRLTGKLELTLAPDGSVKVDGSIAFAPQVACSRCARSIAWPLAIQISERYLPEDPNPLPRERNLSRADLDAYYLSEGAVDLEELVNEAVQMELPTTFVAATEDGSACRVCDADLSTELVYGRGDPEPSEAGNPSPFAALKDLKLKH